MGHLRQSQKGDRRGHQQGASKLARIILSTIVFLALWLLMSGVYAPLTIGLGVASAVFAALAVVRMDRISTDHGLQVHLKPLALVAYLGWLLVEIARSNWAVIKAIMSPEMPIRSHLMRVPYGQTTDVGQTLFANSITLTPGTVTVEVEPGEFLVHVLQFDEGTLASLAEMGDRVTKVESV